MSRAFVKEDVDPPERSGRVRAASGLPPGAVNYMTADGARQWREQLEEFQKSGDEARASELERLLASVTVVEPANDRNSIAFGARVIVEDATGKRRSYRVVGVDEVELYPHGVSWISPVGKVLLAAEVGERVTVEKDERVTIVGVEYPEG